MPTPTVRTSTIASIVVGTDFTPCSAVALGQAVRIASWSGAAIHVVHVIDTIVVSEIETALTGLQLSIRDGLVKDARRAWGDFARAIPGAAGLPIEVSINNRIVGILRRAREDKADLLVMGAFGEGRHNVGFGTVATACVRKSMTDVLLVRDTQAGVFKTIVAAIDFSENSARVLEWAAHFAARDGAELHVLHVFAAPWHQLRYLAPTPLVQPHLQKQYRDALERRLSEFARPVFEGHAGLRARLACHDYNGHRSGIVEYAGNVSADLIVLGTRGPNQSPGYPAGQHRGEGPRGVGLLGPGRQAQGLRAPVGRRSGAAEGRPLVRRYAVLLELNRRRAIFHDSRMLTGMNANATSRRHSVQDIIPVCRKRPRNPAWWLKIWRPMMPAATRARRRFENAPSSHSVRVRLRAANDRSTSETTSVENAYVRPLSSDPP